MKRMCLALILLASGCTTEPKEEPRVNRLVARNGEWDVDVEWREGSLSRHVYWTSHSLEMSGNFDIRLWKRKKPWTQSGHGVTRTYYGPYQPRGSVIQGGLRTDRIMSHERMDFPSEKDLICFLGWDWYNDPKHVAVSPGGTLVVMVVSGSPPLHVFVNLGVYYLTVNGNAPDPDVLRPFVKGTVHSRHPDAR